MTELTAGNALIRSFFWGTDLSGSIRRAGGVGGLLGVREPDGAFYFVGYDGRGNVGSLSASVDGSRTAVYEHDPFGQPIRTSGIMATANPIRFSSKYADVESDLIYFGFRYYSAGTGRWQSRDPIAEVGGDNLFAFALNSSLSFFDRDGRDPMGYFSNPEDAASLFPPPPPPGPPSLRPSLPPYLRTCCDSSTLAKGERDLNDRYQKAKETAARLNFKPVAPGNLGASCVNSSADILRWLAPFPKCWICYLEKRYKTVYIWQYDHQVVVCLGYDSPSAKPKEIMFDWWGDTRHGRNNAGITPEPFRREYPDDPSSTPDRYTGAVTDCEDRPLKPNLGQDCSFRACMQR